MEKELPVDLAALRQKNFKLVELGRYIIGSSYPSKVLLSFRFITFVYEYCVKNACDFIVCQTLLERSEMYEKLGFVPFCDGATFMDKEFDLPCAPMYLDVREKIQHYKEFQEHGFIYKMKNVTKEEREAFLSSSPPLLSEVGSLFKKCLKKQGLRTKIK
ncbi:MAG TPA: hypothetical protein VI959_04010 [Alphaproteobacteria bacterium]|nr:hypothetical protein [Alphaproteobacteria bacterium]